MNGETRAFRVWRWIERRRQDLGYARRSFLRNPGFTLAAVFTLALGIGANAGIFSIVYGILLRPLGYRDADRLVLVETERDVQGTREPVTVYFPLTQLDAFQQRAGLFESVGFYATDEGVISSERGTERVDFAVVSTSFFSTLGGPFTIGRPLGPADGTTPSIVISERLWRRAFGGSFEVLGQQVILHSQRGDGTQREAWRRQPFTIVGVAAAAVQFPTPKTDVWTSADFVRTLNPRCCSFLPLGRLPPGVTIGQATADVALVARALSASNPAGYAGLRARAVGLHAQLVRTVRPSLLILLASVGLVLCVACANVMNLMLARNAARARETAVRLALGASRGRLVAQSLAESGLLAIAGGAAGLMVAAGMVATIRRLDPAGLPRLDAVRVDAPVLLFAGASAALATVLTGVLPLLRSGDASDALRAGRGIAAGPTGRRARRVLVTLELAVSVVLLVGAMLLGRSLVRLINTDVGVVTDHVVTASLGLSLDRERTSAEQIVLVDRVLERMRAVRGVAAVGIGTSLPPNLSRIMLTLMGTNAISYQAAAVPTTPDYFQALGIRLLKGRWFTAADDANHPAVMIMSADAAGHFFTDGDPIGRTLSLPVIRDGTTRNSTMTLVGVIGNVKFSGLDRAADDAIYRPFGQQPWPNVFLVARARGDAGALGLSLPRLAADVDRGIAVSAVSTLDDVVSDAAAQPRFRTLLFAALAGLALTLSAVGLYGVVAYSVSQRTMEIGIRMALGARSGDVVRMIVREGLWLAGGGVAIGGAAAFALARTLTALLFGIAPTDPASFGYAAGALLLFALIASYVPARRASRIDPAIAIRSE